MIRYGESLGILRRQPHELGDVVQMTEEHVDPHELFPQQRPCTCC